MNKITVLKEFDFGSTPIDKDAPDFGVRYFNSGKAIEITDEEIEKQLYNMMRDYRYLGFGFDATDSELKELISKSKVAIGFEAGVKGIWGYLKQRIQNQ